MDEGTLGIVILISTALVVGIAAHAFIRRYFLASVVSAVAVDVFFHFFAYLQLGYIDPFFVVSLITAGVIALIISMLIGIPFMLKRRRKIK